MGASFVVSGKLHDGSMASRLYRFHCAHCDTPFRAQRGHARYCGVPCRSAAAYLRAKERERERRRALDALLEDLGL